MNEDPAETASVIHRKAKVARDEFDAREMSPSKALRLALAKSAAAELDLPLVVRMVEHVAVALTDVEDKAGDDGLLILLDGTQGPPGAAKLDLQFVTALMEAQLMGQVCATEARARSFTATDAALVQPLMNAFLECYAAQLNDCDAVADAECFKFGDRVETGRELVLALLAPDYDLYRLNVDFGPGAKTGVMDLFVPQRPPAQDAGDAGQGGALAAKLEENAMNAPVMLDAVFAPVHLPLQEICTWTPGTVLPLAPEAVRKARVLGAKGHEVARARLGQLNGFRAVRMVIATQDDDVAETDAAAEAVSAPGQEAWAGPGITAKPDVNLADRTGQQAPGIAALSADEDVSGMTFSEPVEQTESDAELDALVEEELALAAARFDDAETDAEMPLTGGPSLEAPALE